VVRRKASRLLSSTNHSTISPRENCGELRRSGVSVRGRPY
jgi:hypothetical protein